MSYDIYSAFGNSVRAKLLTCLSQKPKTVTELIQSCDLAQSAVSQHLLKLKRAGLVETNKQGKNITYSLKYSQAAAISELLQQLNQEVKQ